MTTPGLLELVCPLSLHTATKCCAGLGSVSDRVSRCLIPRDTGGPRSHFDITVGAVFFIKKHKKNNGGLGNTYNTENS